MGTTTSRLTGLVAAFALIDLAGAGPAVAQSGLPNLDHLSPIEEAIAMEVGDVTLTLARSDRGPVHRPGPMTTRTMARGLIGSLDDNCHDPASEPVAR